ncbi:MAG: gephyrin-like molybdotransferase Glp [Verrucomicrobiota bacterium]
MLEESEARSRILEATIPGKIEQVDLDQAASRFSASDILATTALPGFDNSQMDGYAVRAGDAQQGVELTIVGEQAAGPRQPLLVNQGEAVRIFTGAPMPEGADAVVMQEDVDRIDQTRIRINEAAEPGEFVRREGSDLCIGQKILARGDRINPARLGVLASQGLTSLNVHPQPRCAIVTTGDELATPGSELTEGAIYNSNGPMLASLVRQFGAGEVRNFHAPDEPETLRSVLDQAIQTSDICLIAGGVSVGEHDHVKDQLAALDVAGGFWRVRIKPGKPLFFGQKADKLVFGLPGNPVSAYITFLLFALPAFRKWQGQTVTADSPTLPRIPAKLAGDAINDRGNRPHYLRGWLDLESLTFRPLGLQQSHALFALSRTNALVRVEPEQSRRAGETAPCFLVADSLGET